MKQRNLFFAALFILAMKCFSQNTVTEIQNKSGSHYITTAIDYPVEGTYLYNGGSPTVELNAGGNGFYQLHDQPTRAMRWGFECTKTGEPKFTKGFDSAAYTLWYQYTDATESDPDNEWKAVEFTVHFNTLKMFIQGERMKNYTE